MKHTLNFLYKVCLICLVSTVVFVLPAIVASIVFLNSSIYLRVIKNPEYCVVMFFITLFTTIGYINYIVSRGNTSKQD
jgi:hypothetical protein